MDFWLPVIAATFFLYMPGLLILRGFRFSRLISLAAAPLVDIGLYILLGALYTFAGVFCSWYNVVLPVLAFGLVLCLFDLWRGSKSRQKNDSGSASERVFIKVPFERSWSQELMCHAALAQWNQGLKKASQNMPETDSSTADTRQVSGQPNASQRLLVRIYTFMARLCDPRVFDLVGVFCAVGTGLALAWCVSTFALSGGTGFSQEYDNVFHLGVTYSFFTSGDWSPFSATLYPLPGESIINPLSGSGFYPTAFSELSALLISLLGVSVPHANNAVTLTAAGVVFPISMYLFMRMVFRKKPAVALLGMFITPAFLAFPWWFMVFGPLYPNLLAFALVPAGAALVLLLFERGKQSLEGLSSYVRVVFLLLIGMTTLVFVQPNAVFTLGVLMAPYLVIQSYYLARAYRERTETAPLGIKRVVTNPKVAASGVAMAILGLWFFACSLPFMQGVVQHIWPHIKTKSQAFFDILTLSYNTQAPQYLLAALVVVGVIIALKKKEYRWLVVSWVVFNVLYLIAAATGTALKPYLTGVWYSDSFRLAAAATLTAIPLASWGLYAASKAIVSAFVALASGLLKKKEQDYSEVSAEEQRYCVSTDSEPVESYQATRMVSQAMVGIGLCALCYAAPLTGSLSPTGLSAWNFAAQHLSSQYSHGEVALFDSDERDFVREVKHVLPPGAVVVNEPDDGSAFAYATEGMPLYYRYLRTYGKEDETQESVLLRTRLCDISKDPRVKNAVEKTGVTYVLVLDKNRGDEVPRLFTYADNQGKWQGISGINDDTPGFEVVLSRDDMRLYRIDSSQEKA